MRIALIGLGLLFAMSLWPSAGPLAQEMAAARRLGRVPVQALQTADIDPVGRLIATSTAVVHGVVKAVHITKVGTVPVGQRALPVVATAMDIEVIEQFRGSGLPKVFRVTFPGRCIQKNGGCLGGGVIAVPRQGNERIFFLTRSRDSGHWVVVDARHGVQRLVKGRLETLHITATALKQRLAQPTLPATSKVLSGGSGR